MRLSRRELGQLAVVVVGAILLSLAFRSARPVGENVGDRPLVQAVMQDRTSPMTANDAADVTLIVFTDYRCPACRRSHPAMRRAVASDGRVRIIYKDWPIFGPLSERTARVAIASDYQGIYPALHDALMSATRFEDAALRLQVERAGGSWPTLLADLSRHADPIDAQLARNRTQAFGLGLGGTPGYLIGPILIRGAVGEADFGKAIEAARTAS